jgi:hypothetical protein
MKILGVSLAIVLVLGFTVVALAEQDENFVPWKQSWRNLVAESQGLAVEDVNLEDTVWQFAEFIGNSRSEKFLSLVALTNFNMEMRNRIIPYWIPSGAGAPIVGAEIVLEAFQVQILNTDVSGRISGSNGWAAFRAVTPDEYFGAAVILLCLDPSFMGISVQPATTVVF